MMKRTILCSTALVSIALMVSIDLPESFRLAAFLIVLIVSFYFAVRDVFRGEAAVRQDSVFLSSIFAFPLLFVLICSYLGCIVLLVPWIRGLAAILLIPAWSASLWLPTSQGMIYMGVAVAFLGFAWRYRSPYNITKLALMVYSTVLSFFGIWVLWVRLTGQQLQ